MHGFTMAQIEIPSTLKDSGPFFVKRGRVGCVLIHGFTGSPWFLKDLGNHLADKGFTVSAPLLPGHGTKPKDLIGVRWEEWVKTSRDAYIRLQKYCDEIYFLGFSAGGAIALILASEMECRGIITLSAPVKIYDPRLKWIFLARPFIRYWKKNVGTSNVSFPDEINYDRYPIAAVQELIRMLEILRSRMKNVQCPVLIMHARGDKRISENNAMAIYNGVGSTDKQIMWLDDPCHVITKGEDKDRVARETTDFINSRSNVLSQNM